MIKDVEILLLSEEDLKDFPDDKCPTPSCKNDAYDGWAERCKVCHDYFCGACLNSDRNHYLDRDFYCDKCLLTIGGKI